MTYNDFKSKYAGKGIDDDGYYGFQCMDLAHRYAKEVVGHDFAPAPAAKDVWNQTIEGYDKISNTPDGVPQQGDIVIWGTGVGPYGHIAVFDNGDANKFQSFDQNWPLNSLCHIQDHNYNGVLGWFHPKNQTPQVITDVDAIRKARDDNWNLYQAELAKNATLTKQLNDTLTDNQNKDKDIQSLQNELNQANNKIIELQKQPTITTTTTPTTTTTMPLGDNVALLKAIINSKWTWIGVNGWKNRLAQLKKLV